MKTEINLENKSRFFAQYYSQKVFVCGIKKTKDELFFIEEIGVLDYLLLKPLSSVIDEDVIEVAIALGWDIHRENEQIHYGFEFINGGDDNCSLESYAKIVDYLRSKGYALPWNGISVQEMVEAGWIKLVGGIDHA